MQTNNESERQHTLNTDQLEDVSGLGGWLILIQIGLIMSLADLLLQMPGYYASVFDSESWHALTSKSSELYHPLWGITIVIETLYNTFLTGFLIWILFMFYRKKSIVPRLMITLYSVSLIFFIIDTVLVYQNPIAAQIDDGGLFKDLFRSAVPFAIWVPYFLKSKRVKNTFVR